MTQWGKLIPVNGRPAWLRDDDKYEVQGSSAGWIGPILRAWPLAKHVRLRIDHPAYTILSAGEPLWDGQTGWKPWHGGESAPDDWDGGDVMRRNGNMTTTMGPNGWIWPDQCGLDKFDIIAYRPKQQFGSVPNDVSVTWVDPQPYATTRDEAITRLTEAGYTVEPPDPLGAVREALAVACDEANYSFAAQHYRNGTNDPVVAAIHARFQLRETPDA